MIIPIEHIKSFTECPRYYRLSLDVVPALIPFRHSVIESVIKEAYLQAIETGFRMDWKRVIHLVDAQIFKGVDIEDPEKYENGKQLATHILESLQKWYHTLYLESNMETYVDIPMKTVVSKHTVHGIIPMLQLCKEVPIITTISDLSMNQSRLYNNLSIRALAWLVQKELNCEAVKINGLGIGARGALDMVQIWIGQEDHKRVDTTIEQVVRLIAAGVNYPSVTEKCNTCAFMGGCKL